MALNRLSFIFLSLVLSACVSSHVPVAPGVVPEQTDMSQEDEQYGHEVLNELMDRYELDNDDARINRVRDIANRLAETRNPNGNPWHVYVLKDDSFKNAAATRGNYVFVWTGMLQVVQDDEELATIIAHEIGHVLAGHTDPDPSQEVNQMIAGIAGSVSGQVVAAQGSVGALADLAELLIRSSLEALLVNPDLKEKELEADQIGLFLMADAGFSPDKAVNFWRRVKDDPDFEGFPLAFMSSHPSTDIRFTRLNDMLPLAMERYQEKVGGKSFVADERRNDFALSQREVRARKETWVVLEPTSPVYKRPDRNSDLIKTLTVGTKVTVISHTGSWLELSEPVEGYVHGTALVPFRPNSGRNDFIRQ